MSLPFTRRFSLAGSDGDGRRPYLNKSGAFFGEGVPLLETDEFGLWRARPQAVLEKLFGVGFDAPVDLGSRMDGLDAVARAMNKGDLGLAAIVLVQTGLPELPDPVQAEQMAKADGLCRTG